MNKRQTALLKCFAGLVALLFLFPPHSEYDGKLGVGHKFVLAAGEAQISAGPVLVQLILLAAIFGALFFIFGGPEPTRTPGVPSVAQRISGPAIRTAHALAKVIALGGFLMALVFVALLALPDLQPTTGGLVASKPNPFDKFDQPSTPAPSTTQTNAFADLIPPASPASDHQPEQKRRLLSYEEVFGRKGTVVSDDEAIAGHVAKASFRYRWPDATESAVFKQDLALWLGVGIFGALLAMLIKKLNRLVVPPSYRCVDLANGAKW